MPTSAVVVGDNIDPPGDNLPAMPRSGRRSQSTNKAHRPTAMHTRARRDLEIDVRKIMDAVEELRATVDVNSKKIAALQAQVDHLQAKGRE